MTAAIAELGAANSTLGAAMSVLGAVFLVLVAAIAGLLILLIWIFFSKWVAPLLESHCTNLNPYRIVIPHVKFIKTS